MRFLKITCFPVKDSSQNLIFDYKIHVINYLRYKKEYYFNKIGRTVKKKKIN